MSKLPDFLLLPANQGSVPRPLAVAVRAQRQRMTDPSFVPSWYDETMAARAVALALFSLPFTDPLSVMASYLADSRVPAACRVKIRERIWDICAD